MSRNSPIVLFVLLAATVLGCRGSSTSENRCLRGEDCLDAGLDESRPPTDVFDQAGEALVDVRSDLAIPRPDVIGDQAGETLVDVRSDLTVSRTDAIGEARDAGADLNQGGDAERDTPMAGDAGAARDTNPPDDGDQTADGADGAGTTMDGKLDGPALDPLAQLCLDTGGIIETAECCTELSDFGNLCNYGTNPRCSCAPEASHTVKVCKCPGEGRCFAPEPWSLSSSTGCVSCPALNSCNWCDGNALPQVELGCPVYWHCANGVNPCNTYKCGDCESCTHCQAGERCLDDGLCWPTDSFSVTGVYRLAGSSSSMLDLSLATPAYSVVDGSQFYVLLLGGKRITDPSDWTGWAGTVPQPGDKVTITGIIASAFEGSFNGQHDYREIELQTLSLVN
jgi:hypothetical protein